MASSISRAWRSFGAAVASVHDSNAANSTAAATAGRRELSRRRIAARKAAIPGLLAQGLTQAEIAAALGCHPNTVRRYLADWRASR